MSTQSTTKKRKSPLANRRVIETRKVLHDDPWVRASRVHVHFNNGRRMENFLLVSMKGNGFVSVCARLKDGRFLLTRQCRPVAGWNIESVAGACHVRRAYEKTVIEEMIAETGYEPGRLLRINAHGFYSQADRIANRCHLFLAFDCAPARRRVAQDEAQGVTPVILTPSAVQKYIRLGVIKDLPTIAGIFAHFLHEGRRLTLNCKSP